MSSDEEKQAQFQAAIDRANVAATALEAIVTKANTDAASNDAKTVEINTASEKVTGLLEQVEGGVKETTAFHKAAESRQNIAADYEETVQDFSTQFQETADKIKGLLSGATDVSLAKSFNDRKIALRWTMVVYLLLFLGAVGGFLYLGWEVIKHGKIDTITDFFRYAMERSPFIVGLVLLEEFSRRQFGSATKLEEDYAYKESLSISFDGYRNAMQAVDEAMSEPVDPKREILVDKLSNNVLDALKARPGRLIETEKDIPTEQIMGILKTGEDGDSLNPIALIEKMTKQFKGSWFKSVSIILVALMIGIVIGYAINEGGPDIKADVSTSQPASKKGK